MKQKEKVDLNPDKPSARKTIEMTTHGIARASREGAASRESRLERQLTLDLRTAGGRGEETENPHEERASQRQERERIKERN